MRTELHDTLIRWYIAVLVVSPRTGRKPLHPPLVDLQYRLVRANNHEAAYQHALELARQATHSYRNDEGEIVKWECFGLHDLRELDAAELADGTEVYSEIVRYDPGQYVVKKEGLSIFWEEANSTTAAGDMLDESAARGGSRN